MDHRMVDVLQEEEIRERLKDDEDYQCYEKPRHCSE